MIIKFNLIPRKEEVPEEKKEKYIFFKILLFIIGLSFVFIIGEIIVMNHELNYLQRQKAEKERIFRKYQYIKKEIQTLEAENKLIEMRIDTLIGLKRMQGQQLKRIATLISSVKNNKVYFKELALNINIATINGISFDLKDIADYLKNLENQKPIVKVVSIEEIKREKGYISFKSRIVF